MLPEENPADFDEHARCAFEIHGLEQTNKEFKVLLHRALVIIADAIMHGMPITEEVADVRNAICAIK